MGTGTRAWNGSSEQNRQGREQFLEVIERAYAHGITYFDMADMYGAHDYMREAMTRSVARDKVMLLTKTVAREAELIKADLERFRKELDTDVIDVVLLHCMTEANWTETLKPCMDVLADAKAAGQIRAHGVSCHDLGALETAAQSDWVDIMLSRVNPYGVKMDAEPGKVIPILEKAHASGKGMLGMKILGEGQVADKIDESLRYVKSLGCIHAFTIGFVKPDEVDDTCAHVGAAFA